MLEFTSVKVNISRRQQDLRKTYIGINLNKIFNVKNIIKHTKIPENIESIKVYKDGGGGKLLVG